MDTTTNDKPVTAQEAALTHARATIGDNSALNYYAEIGALEDRLADLKVIATDDQAQSARDLMQDAHTKAAELEEARMDAQKPHTDKVEAIRTAYRPLVDRAGEVKQAVRTTLNAWIEGERIRIANEARKRQEEADAAAADAEAARVAAAGGGFDSDPEAAEEAEKNAAEAQVYADHAAKTAAIGPRVASAMGTARAAGQRTTWSAKVINAKDMVKALAGNAEVQAAALKVANALMRASKGSATIKGVEALESRSV